jgi:glycosyltransferase involved in cell wall biosynthesis
MKLGIVTNFYLPELGVNTYFLCRELGHLGIDVTLFASEKYGKKKPPPGEKVTYDQPFKVVRVPTRFILGNMPIYTNALWKLLKENGPYDLLQTEDSYQPYSETVAIYARHYKIPLVLRHDLFEVPPFPYSLIFKFTEWLYGRYVVDSSKLAVVPIDEAGQYLRRLDRNIDYRVVPYGVEMKPVKIDREKNSILCVARLIKDKGVLDLLDALAIVKKSKPDIHLTLIGKGPLKDMVSEKINSIGLRATLIPYVLHENLNEYYSRASLFVLPSYHEAPNLSVPEALNCGTPVVTCDIPGIRCYVDPNDAMLVKPGDVKGLAFAIQTMLDLINAGFTVQPKDFSWPGIAKAYLPIYQEALSKITT